MQNIDLSLLRDLHIMDKPSWWPLAYGWWVVFAGIIFLIIGLYIVRKWWMSQPIVFAVHQLEKNKQECETDLKFLQSLSDLMKRVAILKYGRERISPLTEDKWRDFLYDSIPDVFSKTEAKIIAYSPYVLKLTTHIHRDVLAEKTEKWMRITLKNKNSLDNPEKNG